MIRYREAFQFSNKAAAFFATGFLLCNVAIQLPEIRDIRIESATVTAEDRQKKDSALKSRLTVLGKMPALGFRNILAGNIFLKFLQYFSDISEHGYTSQHLSPAFFEPIISFDPFYQNYYLFLSSSTTLYAAQPQKTVDLMAKGLEEMDPDVMPYSFYVWRYKGVDELLFLGDSQSAKESFENAADWAKRSDDSDSEIIARASQQTADFLATDPESRYAQIAAWHSVLSNAMNDTIRDEAVEQIRQLGGNVDISEESTVEEDSNST